MTARIDSNTTTTPTICAGQRLYLLHCGSTEEYVTVDESSDDGMYWGIYHALRTKHGRAFAERALPWQDLSPEGLEHNHLEDLTDVLPDDGWEELACC